MNLVVDFGNTLIKAALFKGRELISVKIFTTSQELIAFASQNAAISAALVSSVTAHHDSFIKAFSGKLKLIEFTPQTPIPLKNLYKSSSTLGSDRLAASVGGYVLYPSQNVLVIDAGTCLKFNFTSNTNEFLGGSISPGLQMRFKALQHYTGKLPLIDLNESFEKLIGETTEESILSGVINGILGETETMINAYKKSYPDVKVVVCGGDAPFFVKRLKNSIFAESNLVMIGLNEILVFNS